MKKIITPLVMIVLMSFTVMAASWSGASSADVNQNFNLKITDAIVYKITIPPGCEATSLLNQVTSGVLRASSDDNPSFKCSSTGSKSFSGEYSGGSGWLSVGSKTITISGTTPECPSGQTKCSDGVCRITCATPTSTLQLVSKSAIGMGNTIIVTIKIKNIGTTTASPFLIEIQPIKSTQSTVSPTELTCDASYPNNVHKLVYNLVAGETITLTLRTPELSMGNYNVYAVSYTGCASAGGVSIAPLSDNTEGRTFIGVAPILSVTTDICGDTFCTGNEASTCPNDCIHSYCTDRVCNGAETCSTCSVDCGVCGGGTSGGTTGGTTTKTCIADGTVRDKEFYEKVKSDGSCAIADWILIMSGLVGLLFLMKMFGKRF